MRKRIGNRPSNWKFITFSENRKQTRNMRKRIEKWRNPTNKLIIYNCFENRKRTKNLQKWIEKKRKPINKLNINNFFQPPVTNQKHAKGIKKWRKLVKKLKIFYFFKKPETDQKSIKNIWPSPVTRIFAGTRKEERHSRNFFCFFLKSKTWFVFTVVYGFLYYIVNVSCITLTLQNENDTFTFLIYF